MRFKCSPLLLPLSLLVGTVVAQEFAPRSIPMRDLTVVRVRTGSFAGICSGYCDESTTLEPGSIHWIARATKHRWLHPDKKKNGKLTEAEWKNLQNSIDEKVLKGFVGPIGCPGCADSVVVWITVEFSNGAKKSVSFGEGDPAGPPAEVTALLEQINRLIKSRL